MRRVAFILLIFLVAVPVATYVLIPFVSDLEASPTGIQVGDWVEVYNTGTQGLKLRDAPGLSSNRIGNLPDGTIVKLIGGPRYADAYVWWQVRVENTSVEGWAAGTYLRAIPTPPPSSPASVMVTLTLYVHEGSVNGPVLSGVQVSGQDGAGNSFSQTTNASGYVVIRGAPGTWSFTASKSGYDANSWSQSTIATSTRHAYLIKQIVSPQISGVSPSQPKVQATRQWLSILGSGFVSQSQVTLRIGGSTYVIPADRTQFISSGQINVYVGLTDAGTWSAQVTNPGGYQSNVFSFQVKPTPTNIFIAPPPLEPSPFSVQSGSSVTLTATLTNTDTGAPVSGKTITWSTTLGSITPSSTTDSSGRATATFTAPPASSDTPVTVTASFGGDSTYEASRATASGMVTRAPSPPTLPPPTTRPLPSGWMLPWPEGQAWKFSQGPHEFDPGSLTDCSNLLRDGGPICGTQSISSGLDFAPPDVGTRNPSSYTASAVADGIVIRADSAVVIVDHQDGWWSLYVHIANITVTVNQRVAKGAPLGNPSTQSPPGGFATGPNVHFALIDGSSRRFYPIEGLVLSGWQVEGAILKKGERRLQVGELISHDSMTAPPQLPAGIPTFEKDNILSNNNFEDFNSMDSTGIQRFLEQFPNGGLKDYWATDYFGVRKGAAQIIADAAQQFRVNPKVILATIQKESSLVVNNTNSHDRAMGYPANGFGNQVYFGTQLLRRWFDDGTPNQSRNMDCNTIPVTPRNRATEALYRYTPHVGQTADPPGSCADADTRGIHGNYLFWKVWVETFGWGDPAATLAVAPSPTHSPTPTPTVTPTPTPTPPSTRPTVTVITQALDDFFERRPSPWASGRVPEVGDIIALLDAYFGGR